MLLYCDTNNLDLNYRQVLILFSTVIVNLKGIRKRKKPLDLNHILINENITLDFNNAKYVSQ